MDSDTIQSSNIKSYQDVIAKEKMFLRYPVPPQTSPKYWGDEKEPH
jgi:hypothetical protein